MVALARKVFCILHHLLTNREMDHVSGSDKKIKIDVENESSPPERDSEDMIMYIVKAGYTAQPSEHWFDKAKTECDRWSDGCSVLLGSQERLKIFQGGLFYQVKNRQNFFWIIRIIAI
ncbi:MAG TPA: hypothetical protein PKZ03_00835 [Methanothrix sp.]|nr:hypothetical protein [Methanothrix sp.]